LVQEVLAPDPDGRNHIVSLIVEPIEAEAIVIAFRDVSKVGDSADNKAEDDSPLVPAQELHAVKVQLKAAISELETYMEEAKSANEEMQSINEELQSANEELETSKEEMQSVNEELQTVNAELHNKNALLSRTNDDLQNLLDSTQIASLFLDSELRIRNFTPAVTAIFRLRRGDMGRPITDIVSKLDYQDLVHDVEQVQRTLTMLEREVSPAAQNTVAFLMRIRPYRTTDNRLDGTVLTFLDVTEMKLAQQGLLHLASIVQSSDEAIISKNLDGTITSWNAGAERLFGYRANEAVGQSITMLVPPELQDEEQQILARLRHGEHSEHY
jgi:two-component system CheB/CheR fusion protein